MYIFILVLITLIILTRLKVIHKIKIYIVPIIALLFIILIIIYPRQSFQAALQGIETWFYIVFPALFPFFVGSEILINLGLVNFIGTLLQPIMSPIFNVPGSGSFVFAMSITSGYPVGASLIAKLRQDNAVTKTQAERLLSFCNTSGPLFVIGAVGVGMFNSTKIGIIILVAHYLACITTGLIFRFYKYKTDTCNPISKKINIFKLALYQLSKAQKNKNNNLGNLLGNSIKNSLNSILSIGGFIIIFSVIIEIFTNIGIINSLSNIAYQCTKFLNIDAHLYQGAISGIIEITTGCSKISSIANIAIHQKIFTAAAIITWGGISVHFQTANLLSKTDISITPYIQAKAIQAILAGFYSLTIIPLFNNIAHPVFNMYSKVYSLKIFDKFMLSTKWFIYVIATILILGIIINKFFKKKYK